VSVGIKLVKILGDILAVPRVSAEAQDERAIRTRLVRRNVDPRQSVPADGQGQLLRAARHWPGSSNRMSGKDQMGLEFEHRDDRHRDRRGYVKLGYAASAASIAGVTRSTV
jgi:hypothetical protein